MPKASMNEIGEELKSLQAALRAERWASRVECDALRRALARIAVATDQSNTVDSAYWKSVYKMTLQEVSEYARAALKA